MKLHFDSKQEFQIDAVKAVIDIFEGQPLDGNDFEFTMGHSGTLLKENGFGNNLLFSKINQVAENIQLVQKNNGIKISTEDEINGNGWNFSVEMETGTGKTYVYLRTIYELNKLYGFKKFVIVVPSIAIREGVMKNLEITQEHFQNLYDKVPVTSNVYDSRKVSGLRSFASANTIQILVINIDSFAKDENIINKPNDKLSGKKPIEFIHGCNPFVIVDEPQNLDLYKLSNSNGKYDGLKIYEIDFGNDQIELSNGIVLKKGETLGGMNDEVMRFMLSKTVEEHLKKEKNYKGKGIKVLSLIFIDKVKNYREYDPEGNPVKGKFAQWFEEIYQREISKPVYKELITYPIEDLHNGYFSQDNKGRVKDTGGETQLDDDTYKLIMQDKERLLDLNVPLRFIFSHSALREGWDNPNVFQICTLNETKSTIKKRQEIGRGLRLSVNQDGDRIFDRNINRLTVVANERYDDFAKALQKEIEDDCGVDFTGRTKDKSKKEKVNYRKGFEADPMFLQIWEKIRFQTKYSVNYNTEKLITISANAVSKKDETKRPMVRSTKQKVMITDEGVSGKLISDTVKDNYTHEFEIPDMLAYIQNKTELTRSTILEILRGSKRLKELLINPQLFMDKVVAIIKDELHQLMVDGIKYEKIGDKIYEMSLFDDSNFEIYLDNFTHHVSDSSKTIFDNYMPLDSNIESQFAKDCESSEQIEFYFKLPTWFKIPTPIGSYNPDWAIVLKGEKKFYFVAETKSSGQELRGSEKIKIECGKAHFKNFKDVVYKRVTSVPDLTD
ncbi:MAG: DEAD/DEAH box helicase family protein [Prolixibacteraceae bacterium]|nr:DEAD/DEAH box helicase family protein [Prolixibacteraceae bacterium]